jgi:hypothetical protein
MFLSGTPFEPLRAVTSAAINTSPPKFTVSLKWLIVDNACKLHTCSLSDVLGG